MNLVSPVLLAALGFVLLAGLSLCLYAALPQAVWQSATRHGRYVGLGVREVRARGLRATLN